MMSQFEDFAFRVLENERVKLEPLTENHLERLIPFALDEPYLWQHALQLADSPERMKQYVDAALQDRTKHLAIPYLVFDKLTHKVAGSTRFYSVDWAQKTAAIGYTWYGKAFQRTHVNSNCKLLMLEAAFEQMGLERVEFRADTLNVSSVEALIRIGAHVEGVLRKNMFRPDGTRRDSIVMSILKEEWFDSVKSTLQERSR